MPILLGDEHDGQQKCGRGPPPAHSVGTTKAGDRGAEGRDRVEQTAITPKSERAAKPSSQAVTWCGDRRDHHDADRRALHRRRRPAPRRRASACSLRHQHAASRPSQVRDVLSRKRQTKRIVNEAKNREEVAVMANTDEQRVAYRDCCSRPRWDWTCWPPGVLSQEFSLDERSRRPCRAGPRRSRLKAR